MVFDLDGTLVQTEKLKARSYALAASRLRPELSPDEVVEAFKDVVGLSRREVAMSLMDRFELEPAAASTMADSGTSTPWQAYVQIRLDIYGGLIADERVLLEHRWPHAISLLEQARRSCSRVGLATMSYCPQAQRVLRVLELDQTFDFVATRDDVEAGKPNPEIYHLVAHELGVPASECLVVEDSVSGVGAAVAAGMACVAVATPFTRGSLRTQKLLDQRWVVNDPRRLLQIVDQRIREAREETQ